MAFYTEGLLWYLVLIDAIIYNVMAWTQSKKHHKSTHWASEFFPLNRFMGFAYLCLVLWTGFALYRMQLIIFWR
jgi:hypothetical protein